MNRRAMLAGGILLCLLALGCRFAVGSPIYVRHLLHLPGMMPSTLCLYLIGGLQFFLLGALIGGLGRSPSAAVLRSRFRGLLLLVPLGLFKLFWYPLFFAAFAPALALISLLLAVFFLVSAAILLHSACRLAIPILLFELLWLIWLIAANFLVLCLN